MTAEGGVPPALLADVEAAAGEDLVVQPVALGREHALPVRLALGRRHVAHLALDAPASARLRREVACRGWATDAGVTVPDVVDADPQGRWLLSLRVPDEPLDLAGVAAAADAALRLSAAGPPPGLEAATSWRAPAGTRAVRVGRAVRGRLPVAAFRSARAAYQALPARTPAHGDLNDGNVLWDPASGTVRFVDFEYSGLYPAGWDLATLWVDAEGQAGRARVLDRASDAGVSPREVGVLVRWLALRHLADLLTGAPRARHDPDAVAQARARVREATALCQAAGSDRPRRR